MKNALLPKSGSRWLILLLALLLTWGSQARLRFDDPTVRPGIKSAPDRPSGVAAKSKLRPSKRQQVPASNDPIRFTLQAGKRQLTVGEEVELTITAQLMNISPTLLFFLPGSNAYTLKILSPSGFQATGGDFSEYIRGELSYPANTMATYHLRGFFTSPTEGVTFRLLRGEGQATSQSLYEEKARLQLVVQAETNGAARLDDPCSGISLSAQASPNSVSGGGVVNLSATCTGCSSSGGGSTLYSTNFTGEVPNSSFQTDYSDQVKVITNAQNGTDTYYCPVTDHSGTGGTLLRFNGESAGRIWEKSLNVVSGTTYSFTLWVQPVYNGSVASGATQQTLQLKANGALLGSPTFGASNPGCSSGWVQVSGSWTATTTGSVPFTVQVPSGSSWQQAFVLDDIQISSGSGGGGSAASYSWQALESGSTLANASSASAQATVPSTAGTYHYRVTLTSGTCTTSQDVTVAVTGTNACSGISLSAQASPNSVSGGGVVNLSATCTGCSSSGGGSTLYSTNFTGEVPNSSFQTDYSDQVKVITNAQNGTDTYYCPVTDHSGTGGTLLRFNGESAGRIWEKSLNVVSGTTYSFTLWVQPVYNGSVASGATQQTLQLKANGALLGSPTFGASNPGCSSGWVQVSGSWTATTTGSVPFTVQVPSGSSWQQAFVLDDIQISSGSGGGGSAASYSWQALESGSTLANASSASAQATVPSTAGTYHYRVTLTSGTCTTSQDVAITVTGGGAYKVLFVGNSITYHPPSTAIGWSGSWGMAASAAEKDYKHLLTAKLQAKYASLAVKELRDFPGLNESSGPDWEQNYDSRALSTYQPAADFGANLIIMRLSENVDDAQVSSRNFKTYYLQLIDKLRESNPSAKIVLSNSVWGQTNVTTLINQVAQERGYALADLADMWSDPSNFAFGQFADPGVAKHPNDKGMQTIADRICAQVGGLDCSSVFSYQVPATESAWTGTSSRLVGYQTNGPKTIPVGDYHTLENDALQVQVWRGFGCSIQIIDKRLANQELINFRDMGRESGMSSYTGPGPNTPDAFDADAPNWHTGYNPLQAGDSGGHPAHLLFHGVIDIAGIHYVYTKTQQNSWSHEDDRLLQFFYEQWVGLDPNDADHIIVKVRLTHQRADKTFYRAYNQEWPFMMINGAKNVRFYNGNAPFTYAAPTVTDGKENEAAGKLMYGNFLVTEPWMGVEIGDYQNQKRLIGLYEKHFYYGHHDLSDYSYENDLSGRTITYAGSQPFIHLDSDNIWKYEYDYVLGTELKIRQFVYAQAHETTPDFNFTSGNGRCRWYIVDGGHDQKEPFTSNNWNVILDGHSDPPTDPANARGSKLVSPAGSWKASDIQTVYVRMRYAGPETQLQLNWLYNQQTTSYIDSAYPNNNSIHYPKGFPDPNQHVAFNLLKDGQYHTYALNVGGNSTWKDIIQVLELAHVSGGFIAPGEQLDVQYIGTNNPGN